MAKKNLYQIYDTQAECVSGPIFLEGRDAAAIRSFNELISKPGTLPGDYPQHFELLCVGSQDDNDGQIAPHCPPLVITTGSQWLEARAAAQSLAEGLRLEQGGEGKG